jgi:hypothetical protein
MIGNNSCGVHSVQSQFYGPGPRTEDQVLELTILTYDGEILTVGPTPTTRSTASSTPAAGRRDLQAALRDLRDRNADRIRERFPDIPRRVSGYNLPSLLPRTASTWPRRWSAPSPPASWSWRPRSR